MGNNDTAVLDDDLKADIEFAMLEAGEKITGSRFEDDDNLIVTTSGGRKIAINMPTGSFDVMAGPSLEADASVDDDDDDMWSMGDPIDDDDDESDDDGDPAPENPNPDAGSENADVPQDAEQAPNAEQAALSITDPADLAKLAEMGVSLAEPKPDDAQIVSEAIATGEVTVDDVAESQATIDDHTSAPQDDASDEDDADDVSDVTSQPDAAPEPPAKPKRTRR